MVKSQNLGQLSVWYHDPCIKLGWCRSAFFPVSSERTRVQCAKFASFCGALLWMLTQAIRHVRGACIASSVAHSLDIEVGCKIWLLQSPIHATIMGTNIHSIGTSQCSVAKEYPWTYNSSLFIKWVFMCLARSALQLMVFLHVVQSTVVWIWWMSDTQGRY